MRTTMLLMLFQSASAGSAETKPAAPPVLFTFRDYRAGAPVEPRTLRRCEKTTTREIICRNAFNQVGGVSAIGTVWFYDNKLSALMITAYQSAYARLANTLRERYGEPCEIATRSLRSRFGTAIPSQVIKWCFATGSLEISEYGSRLTETRITYQDTANRAPLGATTVDF